MEARTKQRLIGGLVLSAIVAIFLPLLFHNPNPSIGLSLPTAVPEAPRKPEMPLAIPASLPAWVEEANPPLIARVPAPPLLKPRQATVNKTSTPIRLLSETPRAWIIQVASFSDPGHAKQLLNQLRAKGWDAYIRQGQGKKAMIRVFVGPDIDRNKINRIQKELQQQLKLSGVIKKYVVF